MGMLSSESTELMQRNSSDSTNQFKMPHSMTRSLTVGRRIGRGEDGRLW